MKTSQRWIVIAMLSIVVLLPSATVLWLTGIAVRNERAAIEQRLLDSYRRQLELASSHLEQHWAKVDEDCLRLSQTHSGAELFKSCINASVADSVLVFDEFGSRVYPPKLSTRTISGLNQDVWSTAERLEFQLGDLDAAAETYAAVAAVETNSEAEALAWIAYARCLAKSGDVKKAILSLQQRFAEPALRSAKDETGRSMWLDAQLRSMQLLASESKSSQATLAQQAVVRAGILDYGQPLPAAQRLFAMNEFAACFPEADSFPTQNAEELAQRYIQANRDWPVGARRTSDSGLTSPIEEMHCIAMKNAPIAVLIHERDLQATTSELLSAWKTEDSEVQLRPVTYSADEAEATMPIVSMPNHLLAIRSLNPNALAESSRSQAALYTLASVMTVALASVIALAIAFFVSRQLRQAQMKTDLAAVVSHELRTPLASIRLLVDTLSNGTIDDPKGRVEYLALIARENERLSRLIDNFLTYSNIQRGSQRYAFAETKPEDLVVRATTTLDGKLSEEGCHFTSHLADNLPDIWVDADAMVNVLLNLLDNALKFTGKEKQIELNVTADSKFVIFEVVDNGIGVSRADSKRVFEKFFQADSRLARSHDGCGLGLSLVQSVVRAHGGIVEVRSSIDQGSAFVVTIPIVNSNLSAIGEVEL